MRRIHWGIMSRRILPVDYHLPSDHLRSNDKEDLNFFLEFQSQEMIPDDHCIGYPLPFWMCRSRADSEYEISHLLSHNYHGTSSSLSSPLPSRIQVVEDGTKLLMEIIQSMPESSYELSLRDIIDHQHILKEEIQSRSTPQEPFIAKSQHNLPRRKRVQSSASRINSFHSRGFQLRMFIPFSLVFNKKPKKGICSKSPSRPLFNEQVKSTPNTKDGCKIIKVEFSEKMDKKKCESSVAEDAGGNATSKNGVLQGKFPYCCHFF